MRTLIITLTLALIGLSAQAGETTCEIVVSQLNQHIQPQLGSQALVATLRSLNQTGQLPDRFVTKQQARAAGWQPGRPLGRIASLQGKSIGGDRFGNYEHRLPKGNWREADLDYAGDKRGAKRLIFEPSTSGRRFVTVNHYQQFTEIPACH